MNAIRQILPSPEVEEEPWDGMGMPIHPLADLVQRYDYQSALARYKATPRPVYTHCYHCKCEIDSEDETALGSLGTLGREIRPDLCVGCAFDWVEKHR